jgi:hypothetical protein
MLLVPPTPSLTFQAHIPPDSAAALRQCLPSFTQLTAAHSRKPAHSLLSTLVGSGAATAASCTGSWRHSLCVSAAEGGSRQPAKHLEYLANKACNDSRRSRRSISTATSRGHVNVFDMQQQLVLSGHTSIMHGYCCTQPEQCLHALLSSSHHGMINWLARSQQHARSRTASCSAIIHQTQHHVVTAASAAPMQVKSQTKLRWLQPAATVLRLAELGF